MAFEWSSNQEVYSDAYYKGDAGYFTRSTGGGLVGQLSTRTALRGISAYLRTLAVAKHLWKMPAPLAAKHSLLALPLHPTLAFLRPRRPDWYPTFGFDFSGDSKATEASIKCLLTHVEQARLGDELIAFSSPVLISAELCIEVSVVRWAKTCGSSIVDADLATHHESFWFSEQELYSSAVEPFSTTTSVRPPVLEELIDKKSASWPLAGFLDFDRIGYLQHDLYPSRLFVPTLSGTTSVDITPSGGQLEAKVGGKVVADFMYWNAGWGPARPSQLRGNCGTALISRGTAYREVPSCFIKPMRSFYLWQIRILRRDSGYGQFSEELTSGAMLL